MRLFLLCQLTALLGPAVVLAQSSAAPPALPIHDSPPRLNDLVHTRLALRFDYARRYAYGQEWVTLRPHAYATDSLLLDAKGMDIKAVALVQGAGQQPLKYHYNGRQLRIGLDRAYKPGEAYTVFLDYVARPDELGAKGSAAIRDAKGLYFINPDSAVAGKPRQIWTQGETEASSVWFPTIDRPNQKTTADISLTVPARYVTLSNGLLVGQKTNGDGTRTDQWQQAQPHAPYLFMLAVGDFRIRREQWRGKEISYYLEPQYAAQTQAIFGRTPEMLEFFSQKLGVEFPWAKYAQVVVRDYVSGAMENTSASLFGEHAQGSARELLDWEYALVEREIAHELFHQWFGDYVTCESWGQLTVNESFANFSEVLWAEHKLGPDAAGRQAYRSLRTYLANPANFTKPLVRRQYADQEDVFDAVTYQKGGRILQLLRHELGEDVFFRGLNLYLTRQALGTGEAEQLRLALEDASGRDLTNFFQQWYYRPGHPVVSVDYGPWDAATKTQPVTLRQTQGGTPYELPLDVDVYAGPGAPQRHRLRLREATQTFQLPAPVRADLVNVDAENVLVWQKTDNKPLSAFVYQYRHAPRYLDRLEAILACAAHPEDAAARQTLLAALSDKYYALRWTVLENLDLVKQPALRATVLPTVRRLAAHDPSPQVQAEALKVLGKLGEKRDARLFAKALDHRSYTVQGAALQALAAVDLPQAVRRAAVLQADHRAPLSAALVAVYAQAGEVARLPFVLAQVQAAAPLARLNMLPSLAQLLVRAPDEAAFRAGLAPFQQMGIEYKPFIGPQILTMLQNLRTQMAASPVAAPARQAIDEVVRAIEQTK
ncbi:M1 family metallopeptidase [Hymenobacter edaphi]|uniref:Aminopeptidase N n=1 Tax=Hymenobacter edaphi TaxID=2211146 RepID=A0A328BZ75_9BACT|nr:M1 family metallopeptidase [Hymenobacter edaphi]RAK70448.1 M1 family peptidase [Hymenobacter edaphi]